MTRIIYWNANFCQQQTVGKIDIKKLREKGEKMINESYFGRDKTKYIYGRETPKIEMRPRQPNSIFSDTQKSHEKGIKK